MIATHHFVYIHTSRTAGTFLNRLIMHEVAGARMIQYHGTLAVLPEQFSHLPVIGFVRDPYDWYVSMFYDYRRKQQYVFQVLSEMGRRDFETTVMRFLNLGDQSAESRRFLEQLIQAAPMTINRQKPSRRELPGLIKADFEQYPEGVGYFSWLFNRMYASEREHDIRVGRFENLREDARQLMADAGAPITEKMRDYLAQAAPANSSPRPSAPTLSDTLCQLIAERDAGVIEQYGYQR